MRLTGMRILELSSLVAPSRNRAHQRTTTAVPVTDRAAPTANTLIHVQLNGRRDGATTADYIVNAECGFPEITGSDEFDAPVNYALPAWDIATSLVSVTTSTAASDVTWPRLMERDSCSSPARTLAEHTDLIPSDLLGLDGPKPDNLRQRGVIAAASSQ
jgi:hypothetical protein